MDLVPMYEGQGGVADGMIQVSPERQRTLGVRIGQVDEKNVSRTLRTSGLVVPDETRVSHVHVKTPGWIEDVYVDFVGQLVRSGQPAMFLAMTSSAFASQTTVTGVLTDDMCTKKHMGMGRSNADCVRECVKGGAKFAVVSGGKTYILSGDKEKLNELAGKKVKVTGDVKGTTLTVASIETAQ